MMTAEKDRRMSNLEKIQKGMRVLQILSKIILMAVSLLFGGIITAFVYRYFTAELKEGTSFTNTGAERIKRLGIMEIVLSVISMGLWRVSMRKLVW